MSCLEPVLLRIRSGRLLLMLLPPLLQTFQDLHLLLQHAVLISQLGQLLHQFDEIL